MIDPADAKYVVDGDHPGTALFDALHGLTGEARDRMKTLLNQEAQQANLPTKYFVTKLAAAHEMRHHGQISPEIAASIIDCVVAARRCISESNEEPGSQALIRYQSVAQSMLQTPGLNYHIPVVKARIDQALEECNTMGGVDVNFSW